jgi:hypothetical protein
MSDSIFEAIELVQAMYTTEELDISPDDRVAIKEVCEVPKKIKRRID